MLLQDSRALDWLNQCLPTFADTATNIPHQLKWVYLDSPLITEIVNIHTKELTYARNVAQLLLFRHHVVTEAVNYGLYLVLLHLVHQWAKAGLQQALLVFAEL